MIVVIGITTRQSGKFMATKKKVKKKEPLGFMIRKKGTNEFSDGRDRPTVGGRSRRKVWKSLGLLMGHVTRVDNICKKLNARYPSNCDTTIGDYYGDCEIVELKVAKITDLTEELFLKGI
jgi:hypothetical protein